MTSKKETSLRRKKPPAVIMRSPSLSDPEIPASPAHHLREWRALIMRSPLMSDAEMRASLAQYLVSAGFRKSTIEMVVKAKSGIGDETRHNLVFQCEDHIDPAANEKVPYFASLLLCLFVAPDKQEQDLGDFEEKLNKVWIPTCGPRIGRLLCVWHAVWSMGAIIRFGVLATIADRITRAFGW